MYKFMGDGWILLFQPDVHSGTLFEFLKAVSSLVLSQFITVQRLLHKFPEPTGLTFGIDTGELIRLEMNEQVEYLGRAINVAARLQGEAKRFASKAMSNVALISKASFNSLQPYDPYIKAENQTVTLRNISGGEQFPCYLISTIDQESAQDEQQINIAQRGHAEATSAAHPPQLVVMQKKDSGFYGVKRQGDGAFFIFVTMLIANQSNGANSVVAYKAEIMKTDGKFESLKIEQGRTDDFEFCVTPLNIPPYSTIEAVVAFISVHPAKYGQPFKMNITVVDVQGKSLPGLSSFKLSQA